MLDFTLETDVYINSLSGPLTKGASPPPKDILK